MFFMWGKKIMQKYAGSGENRALNRRQMKKRKRANRPQYIKQAAQQSSQIASMDSWDVTR